MEMDHLAFVLGSVSAVTIFAIVTDPTTALAVAGFICSTLLPMWLACTVAIKLSKPPYLCSVCGHRSRQPGQVPPKRPDPPQTVEVLEIKPGKRIVTPPPVPRAKTLR